MYDRFDSMKKLDDAHTGTFVLLAMGAATTLAPFTLGLSWLLTFLIAFIAFKEEKLLKTFIGSSLFFIAFVVMLLAMADFYPLAAPAHFVGITLIIAILSIVLAEGMNLLIVGLRGFSNPEKLEELDDLGIQLSGRVWGRFVKAVGSLALHGFSLVIAVLIGTEAVATGLAGLFADDMVSLTRWTLNAGFILLCTFIIARLLVRAIAVRLPLARLVPSIWGFIISFTFIVMSPLFSALQMYSGWTGDDADSKIAASWARLSTDSPWHDLGKGIELLEEAASLEPDNWKIQAQLVPAYQRIGEYDLALEKLQYAVAKAGTNDAVSEAAYAAMRMIPLSERMVMAAIRQERQEDPLDTNGVLKALVAAYEGITHKDKVAIKDATNELRSLGMGTALELEMLGMRSLNLDIPNAYRIELEELRRLLRDKSRFPDDYRSWRVIALMMTASR